MMIGFYFIKFHSITIFQKLDRNVFFFYKSVFFLLDYIIIDVKKLFNYKTCVAEEK